MTVVLARRGVDQFALLFRRTELGVALIKIKWRARSFHKFPELVYLLTAFLFLV
jgi:hypothetical protein